MITLPRLQQSGPITDDQGLPSFAFHVSMDKLVAAIEESLNNIADNVAAIAALQAQQTTIINDLSAAVADIVTAQAAADAAQADATTGITNAAAAQTTANTVKKTDRLSGSSVYPANVLSAVDAGTDASITVATHSRLYGDGTTVPSVATHTFTGLAYSTKYAVYYDDATLTTATPTYHTTTTLSNAVANFVNGRHFVGIITTPASGAGSTTGGSSAPGTDPADRPDMSTL